MSSLQQNWRKRQNRFCLEGRGWRNDPNNVCTYEYMNKEKKLVFFIKRSDKSRM
jgi:hypothetical protein